MILTYTYFKLRIIMNYSENKYPLQNESYQIIRLCMEVQHILGKGFLEIVYKDAIEHELLIKGIPYIREKKFEIMYKDIILPHFYFADFIVFEKIILEVKAQKSIVDEHVRWVINYLAISKCELGLILNFNDDKLGIKRVVL